MASAQQASNKPGGPGGLAQLFIAADSAIERRRCVECATPALRVCIAPAGGGGATPPLLTRALLLLGAQDGQHLQAAGRAHAHAGGGAHHPAASAGASGALRSALHGARR